MIDIKNFIKTRCGGHLYNKMISSLTGVSILKNPVDGLDEKLRLILKQNAQLLPKYHTLVFFFTRSLVRKFKLHPLPWVDLCDSLVENYSQKDRNININNIKLNVPEGDIESSTFYFAFGDIILPCLTSNQDVLKIFYDEGPYEMGEVKLAEGDTVIDCGANIGEFSAVAASKKCNVIAFEPMMKPRAYLKITAQLNEGRIHIAPYAVSDKAGTVYFKEELSNLGGSRMSTQGIAVETLTIDDYVKQNNIQSVDFIKADIEGAERLMLKGAQETIRRFHPKMAICTYHLSDDPTVLRELILQACPEYVIEQGKMKLYAHVPAH